MAPRKRHKAELQQTLLPTFVELLCVACPLCGVAYSQSAIETHADACANAQEYRGDTAPVAQQPDEYKVREVKRECDEEDRETEIHMKTHGDGERKEQDMAGPHEMESVLDTTAGAPAAVERKPRKACAMPAYKMLDGMPFAVDAFCYGRIDGCIAYFLTHFHSDHYRGLGRLWEHGPIYGTEITASLMRSRLGVDAKYVHALPMDTPVEIRGTSVRVTCIDANHCPGACLFLFDGPSSDGDRNIRLLHCGDFRAAPFQVRHDALRGGVDTIYLDTTYLSPRHCFPTQRDVLDAFVNLVQAPAVARGSLSSWLGARESDGQVLVVVGTYSIGKERVAVAAAHALGTRVYCLDARQAQLYEQTGALEGLLTYDALDAQVHVASMHTVTVASINAWMSTLRRRGAKISHAIGIRPTGWTFNGSHNIAPDTPVDEVLAIPRPIVRPTPSRGSTSAVRLYSLPYSEHSSFVELMAFCIALPHKRIIPTVGSAAAQERMSAYTRRWTVLSTSAIGPKIANRNSW